MLARLYPWVLITLFACSIVDDNAITSQEELKKLKLRGFEIDQQTNNVHKTVSSVFLSDSVVNINDVVNGTTVNRIVRFKIPVLGNVKMKFRSGTTAEVEMSISYISSTKPYTVAIYQKDSIIELYRFRYDASGRLNRIITFIDPIDNKPLLSVTNDTLIYDTNGEIKTIDRRSPDQALKATIGIGYVGANGPDQKNLQLFDLTYKGFTYRQSQNRNCNNGSGPTACAFYDFGPQNGGSGQSQYRLIADQSFNSLSRILLEDMKSNNSGACCRAADTYYFHPLMLLRNQITRGDYLLLIYMMDWWVPGAVVGNGIGNGRNETVTINFLYGQ